jgi:hypothetical protein
MKYFLRTSFFAVLLSLVLTVLTLNWIINDDITKCFLDPVFFSVESEAISNVDVEFSNRKIFLNVHLNQPMTCKEVITLLGIESFSIKEKVYAPSCSRIDKNLVKITYGEVIQV